MTVAELNDRHEISTAGLPLSWSAVGTDVEPNAGGGQTIEIAFRLLGRELFGRVRGVVNKVLSLPHNLTFIFVFLLFC